MTIAKMLAIRRDLQSGYHKFKQIGQTVYHTLDGVNWVKAFVLPDSEGAATVTNNSIITNNQLWKVIQIADENGKKPDEIHAELKRGNAEAALASCWAIRGIIYTVFAKFYREFVKEYLVNETAALTEQAIKDIFVEALDVNEYLNGTPLQFLGDASVFLTQKMAEYADEFALFFDETFYQLVSTFAFTLYNPDLSPKTLIFNELVCNIAASINTGETLSNFRVVSGNLPTIVYDAWERFASRQIWRTYLFLKAKAPKDVTCPCGKNCYSVVPSACIPLVSQAQPFLSCVGEGDYLKNVVWSGTYQNRLEFQTFYPLGIETPKKIASIHVTFDTNGVYDTGTASPQILCYLQDTYGNWSNPDIPGFPFEGYGKRWVSAGNFEYSFATAPNNNTLYQSIRFRCDASYIINDAANHAAVKAYVKSVIVCTKE